MSVIRFAHFKSTTFEHFGVTLRVEEIVSGRYLVSGISRGRMARKSFTAAEFEHEFNRRIEHE